jgi:hypothetical protein
MTFERELERLEVSFDPNSPCPNFELLANVVIRLALPMSHQ